MESSDETATPRQQQKVFGRPTATTRQRSKVSVEPFQRLAESRGRASWRAPQSAKFSYMAFLFAKLFLFALWSEKKKRVVGLQTRFGVLLDYPLFSLMSASGKEKSSQKRNRDLRISRSAEHDEGSAPSTAPPFKKGGRKLTVGYAQNKRFESF